jgi:hypothetical protein
MKQRKLFIEPMSLMAQDAVRIASGGWLIDISPELENRLPAEAARPGVSME